MPDQFVFSVGEAAPVSVEERVVQVWPGWPDPEPQAHEVAGGQVGARVLEVDEREVPGLVDQPVARLEVEMTWHPVRDAGHPQRGEVAVDDRGVLGGQQCLRLAGPVADAVVEPAGEPGKLACRFGVVEAA